MREQLKKEYPNDTIKENIPIGTALTAIVVCGNSKIQTSALWNEYMRRYWVKDHFIEPYHPNQNPIEQDMAFMETWLFQYYDRQQN